MNNIGQLKRVSQNRIVQFFQIDWVITFLLAHFKSAVLAALLAVLPRLVAINLFETNRRVKYPYK